MRITKLRLAVISVLVVAAAATPWLLQRQSEIKLREEISSLQTQLAQISQQRTEDRHPSEALAQAGGSLPNDEFRELLRLRNEVGLLRQQTNELLKAQNSQLRAGQPSGKSARPPSLAAGDSVPVGSLSFAGYATPEAAFQSTLSADAKGDLKTFFDGFTPERRQEEEKHFAGKSEDELAAQAAQRAAHFAEENVRILNSNVVSQDEAELVVVLLGAEENGLVTFTMKRIAGQWKISGDRKL